MSVGGAASEHEWRENGVPGCGKKRGSRRVLGVARALIVATLVMARVPPALVEHRKQGRSREEEGDWGRLRLGLKLGWLGPSALETAGGAERAGEPRGPTRPEEEENNGPELEIMFFFF
jgi:hypothetical protein